ncbi:MAG: beta-lactamase family protein [Polyangiaceae bacterium]|nr:beta-lactamase family protein [Polyangiaceae bacterium]
MQSGSPTRARRRRGAGLALALSACLTACASEPAGRTEPAAARSAPDAAAVASAALEPKASSAQSAVAEPGAAEPGAAEPGAPFFEADAPDDWLPRRTARAVGLDPEALARLVADAAASDSDSLVVLRGSELVVERYFGRPRGPIETRSLTKSVVALGVLALVADGAIASLDAPLATFFPALGAGDKSAITLRHVLTHTSGLASTESGAELDAAPDRLAYALARPLVAPPGQRFAYSNEATALLSGVVAAAAGRPVDAYLAERLFAPLGIRDVAWARDRAGHVQTYFGLRIGARDLARLGMLVRDLGRFAGRALLPPELVRAAVTPSAREPSYGLLWWLRTPLAWTPARAAALARTGFGRTDALAPLLGRRFASEQLFFDAARPLLDARADEGLRALRRGGMALLEPEPSAASAFYGVGALGQRLVVYPAAELVVVRQHRRRAADATRSAAVTWVELFASVEALGPGLAP